MKNQTWCLKRGLLYHPKEVDHHLIYQKYYQKFQKFHQKFLLKLLLNYQSLLIYQLLPPANQRNLRKKNKLMIWNLMWLLYQRPHQDHWCNHVLLLVVAKLGVLEAIVYNKLGLTLCLKDLGIHLPVLQYAQQQRHVSA